MNSGKIVAGREDIEGSTRGPRGPKKKCDGTRVLVPRQMFHGRIATLSAIQTCIFKKDHLKALAPEFWCSSERAYIFQISNQYKGLPKFKYRFLTSSVLKITLPAWIRVHQQDIQTQKYKGTKVPRDQNSGASSRIPTVIC